MVHVDRLRSTATVPHLFEKRCPKNFRQNFVLVVSVARITLSATIPKTVRAVVCKQAYTTALSIFTILADSCYSRKRFKTKVLFSTKSKNKRLILKLYKNIDNPSKPPLERGGLVAEFLCSGCTNFSGFLATQYS